MKRFACIVLLLLLFAGCAMELESGVTFYYPRKSYIYNAADGVIASETREASGHLTDMQYLLTLYLQGPMDADLEEAFPTDTTLLSVKLEDTQLLVELSDTTEAMTDARFSLACTCLTLTCRDAFGVQSVTVVSGERSITLDEDMLLLYEDPFPDSETEETE